MMQSKIKAWLRAWLPYVAVMVLLFWGVNAWRARDVPNLAPDWQASTVNGDATSLTLSCANRVHTILSLKFLKNLRFSGWF